MPTDQELVGTSVRPDWPDLPHTVRASVEDLTGSPITQAITQRGGFSSGLATRLLCADGTRLFLKGITTDHPLCTRYQEEAAINQALPTTVPVPRLRRAWETDGWWLMAFDDITNGQHPDLTPGSPDTPRALALLDQLPATVTPSPIEAAPGFVEAVGAEFCGWQHLADTGADLDPWSTRNLNRLADAEHEWFTDGDGTTLLHADLRPDNMLLTADSAYVIDWAYLHQGPAWADPALFAPHLIRAGHTPPQAEQLMTDVTAWTSAPAKAITSFAIALTGYWERSSRLPAPPQVPYLRPYQAQMARIGRTWVQHRTGWN